MAVRFKIKEKGIRNLSGDISREAMDELFDICNAAGKKAKAKAQANAPVYTGLHRSNIIRRTERRKSSVNVLLEGKAPYAPFLEFGTGSHVRIPEGFEDMASEYRGERPGNMIARPHIIPAMQEAAIEITEELERRLSKI